MTIKEIKKHALEALSGNWGIAILVSIVVYGGFFYFIPYLLQISLSGWIGRELSWVELEMFNIPLQLLLIPLTVGISWFFLELSRKQTIKFKDIFIVYSDLRLSLKMVGLSILTGILVLLWALLFIIPGIVKSIAYSQAYYILKDKPNLSILEAIKESNRIMKGHKLDYFLLMLSFIGWMILSIFTLGIGLIFLSPYVDTSRATFYLHISNED
ncbi:DUF975 family protein [Chengkuizengella axinellae]|uniref:DUF975 family protein n=1 Tax=Chengkuizengella axinellae TaxID=3064388 RepID=A0ABT9IWL8_9BACL|nr:DUF975 family protein [Chengkuizengella sp. 2205SS18-9]MDP5273742.1 DUF975 family protein [Chengkuizengella sp. 2205SS18-9]